MNRQQETDMLKALQMTRVVLDEHHESIRRITDTLNQMMVNMADLNKRVVEMEKLKGEGGEH